MLSRKREAELMRDKETRKLNHLSGISDVTKVTSQSLKHPKGIQDDLPVSVSSMDDSKDSSPASVEKQVNKTSSEVTVKKSTKAELISDTYNGGETEKYKWSQTLNDLDIRIPIAADIKSKDVRVEIKSDHVMVELLRPERKVRPI